MNWEAIGRFGYEAYAKQTGGKTFDGREMPQWDQLPQRTRDAWAASAEEIARVVAAAVLA